MIGRLARWFMVLSDPQGQVSAEGLAPLSAEELEYLIRLSRVHGVTATLRETIRRDDIGAAIEPARLADLAAHADEILFNVTLRTLLLRHQLRQIQHALGERGLAAVEIKGADFADHIYPHPTLRPFTDIDLLARRDHLDAVAALLPELGLIRVDEDGLKHDDEYGEQGYAIDDHGLRLRVELHWNLVNSPSVREGMSVEYDDVVIDGRIAPESRLVVAAVHGATSHQFDGMKFVIDVLQAARALDAGVDDALLSGLVARTGSAAAVSMACWLITRLTGLPVGAKILEILKLRPPNLIDRVLLGPRVVAPTTRVILRKARMCGYRHRLKRRWRYPVLTGAGDPA